MARAVTEITGVAISPLLGVTAVGAWRYWQAPDSRRAHLPWFCRPWVWGTGFALLALCFLKDSLGAVAPPLLKKPLDVLELFENKASALVASTAFVPVVAAALGDGIPPAAARLLPATPAFPSVSADALSLAAAGGILPAMDAAPGLGLGLAALLLIPPAIAVFLTVWLAGHAINVLILLCPFGFVDALLKLFRTGFLVAIVAAYALNPWLGAVFCLALILAAAVLAPWTFRLTLFGTLVAVDVLFPESARSRACPDRPHAFLARRTGGVPARTYGRLSCAEDGALRFAWRPWLVGPTRTILLPRGTAVALTEGLIFPSLLLTPPSETRPLQALLFLPRYRTLEPALAACLRIQEIRPGGVLRGMKAAREWLSQIVIGGRRPKRA